MPFRPCFRPFYRHLQLVLVALAVHLSISAQVSSPRRGGDTISFREHIVVFNTPKPDTLPASDQSAFPVVMLAAPAPETIDGVPVHRQVDHPPFSADGINWEDALFYHVRRKVAALEDGRYRLGIYNLVAGKEGRIVYYELQGIARFHPRKGIYETLSGPLPDEINREIAGFLDGLTLIPAVLNSRPVAAAIRFPRSILVQGHAAWLQEE